jgi:Domain of unknown function (DUF4124)
MRKGILLLLSLLWAMTAVAEVIYKWVDETGQPHFSDVPREGAVEINVQPVQTFSMPRANQPSAPSVQGEAANDAAYESIRITSPAMEETIWNTGGLVTVTVGLQPGLRMGHQIRIYMDNQQVAVLPAMTSSVQLTNVVRGAHQLFAEVVDENGKSLLTSDPTTFYYQQTSVNRRPKRPTPRAPAGG